MTALGAEQGRQAVPALPFCYSRASLANTP